MKRERSFGLLIAAALLSAFAVSCSLNGGLPDPDAEGEEVEVAFSVMTEDALVSPRATRAISDGKKATALVYAVYVKDAKGDYKIVDQYGQGSSVASLEAGEGQTVLETEKLLDAGGEKISLRLMRGKTYYFAFWAQNPGCKAYVTQDLQNVEVKYDRAKNNDELRDAFFASYELTVQANMGEVKVVLTRALAQVNVGTAGWDYNLEVSTFGNKYTYSRIVLDGVYSTMNVLTEEVADATTTVSFDWAKIPAYVDIENVPEDPTVIQDKEEFLKVDLNGDGECLPWLDQKPGAEASASDDIYTETFKYLSMCYVLAPSHRTSLTSATFFMGTDEKGTVKEEQTKDGNKIFEIWNVPVQRNWRTNILGGTGKKNTLFNPRTYKLYVELSPNYWGDYNDSEDTNGSWPQKGGKE